MATLSPRRRTAKFDGDQTYGALDGDTVALGVTVRLALELAPPVTDAVPVAETDGVGEGLDVTDDEGVLLPVGVRERLGVGNAVAAAGS